MRVRTFKISIIGLICACMISFTACSQNAMQAEEYLQHELNASYKNIYTSELLQLYDEDITQQVLEENFSIKARSSAILFLKDICGINTDTINEGTIERGTLLFEQIYKSAKFEIGTAEKIGNDYEIGITIHPIDIVIKSITQEYYDLKVSEIYTGADLNEQEFEDAFANAMLDALEQNIGDITFAEPIEFTVLLIENNGYFELSSKSLMDIDNNIILF